MDAGAKVAAFGVVRAGADGLRHHPPTPEMVANNDPYEPTNREMLGFNGKIDRYFVVPTVAVYFVLVPDPAGAPSIVSWKILPCPPPW